METMSYNPLNSMFKRINITVLDIPGQSRKTSLCQQLTKMSIFIIIEDHLQYSKNLYIHIQLRIYLHIIKYLLEIFIMVYFLHMVLRTSQIQTQKQILAPSMQQSIEVLLLPITELNTAIEQELQENPLLEIDEKINAQENKQIDTIIEQRIKSQSERTSFSTQEATNMDDDISDERPITRTIRLDEHLLQQLRLETSDIIELQIGELIIGNLDDNGYLKSTCQEIAQWLSIDNIEKVHKVLLLIQTFDPLGIASRNLKECLLAQVNYHFNGHTELAIGIISNHLDDLGRKKFTDIAKKLKISIDKVKDVAKSISYLEPKPARKYQPFNSNIYIKPDIIITKDENYEFHVHISNENIPHLRISATYQKILKQPNRTKEETEFIREKIKNALLFMKSIEQRHQTLRNIAEFILNHQKAYFIDPLNPLKPLILKDVATVIERNESTVCRAISNKFIETPNGLYPIKYFFSQAVNDSQNGESIASRTIKEDISDMIDEEDKTHPLSDNAIQLHF